MVSTTPLFERHEARGACFVDFHGWRMPLHYGSQIEEHHAVRRAAGAFDVSHMGILDVQGPGSTALLRRLLANDVARLGEPGRALYACMLNDAGGIIDDLIAFRRAADGYRLVVNAGSSAKDLAWIQRQCPATGVELRTRSDLAMIAVQGPQARARTAALLAPGEAAKMLALPGFGAAAIDIGNQAAFVARTGYTGEDGVEIMLPGAAAGPLWDALIDAGVLPCGLGARDTLRLEAGMNLYGNDMDESTTPLESGLGWTVALGDGREFVGRAALEAQRAAGVARKLIGVMLDDRGVLRSHQRLRTAAGDGETTSGGFSPTLNRSIGLARVPVAAAGAVDVDIRGKTLRAHLVSPPFVRLGRAVTAP